MRPSSAEENKVHASMSNSAHEELRQENARFEAASAHLAQ